MTEAGTTANLLGVLQGYLMPKSTSTRVSLMLAIALATFARPAAAEKSTAVMLEFCDAAMNVTQGEAHGAEIGPGGYCLGFIDGVVNTAQLYRRIPIGAGRVGEVY